MSKTPNSPSLDRYKDERLPRYTSYPTAPQFSGAVTGADYADWLAALPADASGSLYVHVPFCRSMCWYCGCHTTITKHEAPITDYLDVMRREIALVADRLSHPLHVRHIHFGGGTPTVMKPEEFTALMDLVRSRFDLQPDCEIAIEIDPRTLTREMVTALARSGVNRASLGVQSFDITVQRAINRVQSVEQTANATRWLREAGIGGINFDLIYGLPFETVDSCLDTVAQCVAMKPDRFAVFGYAHIPSFKKHQRKLDEATMPDGTMRQAQAEAIANALRQAGYLRIGLDHYALPNDPMVAAQDQGALHRNFQGYTTDTADALIGFGASSIGRLPQGYLQNEVSLPLYAERIAKGELAIAKGYRLTEDDRLRADLIERLMCDFRVDVSKVCARHGADAAQLLRSISRLSEFEEGGLIRLDHAEVEVAPEAHHLVRTVASAFDAYLGASGRTHARAV